MEKNNFNKIRNSFKDNGILTRAMRDSNNKRSIHNSQSCEEDFDNIAGFSWPPRSYTCSFCKREFRSAQALGGHMNVHRKDRARLKSSPPGDHFGQVTTTTTTTSILNLNLYKLPNPNPNFSTTTSSPSSSSSLISPFSRSLTLPTLISPPPPLFSVPPSENVKWVVGGPLLNHPLTLRASDFSPKMKTIAKSLYGQEGDASDGCIKSTLNKPAAHDHAIVRLDLEIGLLGDSNIKEDLDLELRLGYS